MDALDALSFDHVLRLHAACSLAVGACMVLVPHALFGRLSGEPYSHVAHELARCYGGLTLAQAWFAWRTLGIADGRVRRMLAESYAVCYALTSAALCGSNLQPDFNVRICDSFDASFSTVLCAH